MAKRNEDTALGCAAALFGVLVVAWLGFSGLMIFWVVSWLTSK